MNALLLSDGSPSLRLRASAELEGVSAGDDEVAALRAEVAGSVEVKRALSLLPGTSRDVAYMLCRLAYLRYEGPEIQEGAERLFAEQRRDGSWPLWRDDAPAGRSRTPRVKPRSEGHAMIPLQTSLPLRGLASVGYATDPRAEKAYDWLLSQRLADGAWPGDVKADLSVKGPPLRVPGYRSLPSSPGCRSATTGALACFALHPERRTSVEARAALDHLLTLETRDRSAIGWEVSRLLGFEPATGTLTFYATFDLAFLLDIASRCGASKDDVRIRELVGFLEDLRGPFRLWEHHSHPQLSRWLSLDLETSLKRVESGDWSGSDVRLSFQAYPKRRRRY